MTTPNTTCLFPHLAPSSAYHYGCRCLPCVQDRKQKAAASNKKNQATRKRYKENHRQETSKSNAKYHAKNRKKNIERMKILWQNPQFKARQKLVKAAYHAAFIQTPHGKVIMALKHTRQRARKRNQTPILTTEEKVQIYEIYKKRNELTESTGIPHHVDHIIPLSKGGEHHPNNLQILTAEQNLKKGARIL